MPSYFTASTTAQLVVLADDLKVIARHPLPAGFERFVN
jgi:hypothetical protein